MDSYRNAGFHHGSIDKSWISMLIHIEMLDFNTRNPIYRLYKRYRHKLKYSFDTDFSVKLYPDYKKSKKTDCSQDTDKD